MDKDLFALRCLEQILAARQIRNMFVFRGSLKGARVFLFVAQR